MYIIYTCICIVPVNIYAFKYIYIYDLPVSGPRKLSIWVLPKMWESGHLHGFLIRYIAQICPAISCLVWLVNQDHVGPT